MSDSGRLWDAADGGRPRRANRGALLPALLATGLDSAEEELLRDLSDATTDSTFAAGSDEETVDEVDSDFSDEEVDGVLDGEVAESEAAVRRTERAERRRERARAERRAEAAAEAAAATRRRRSATIPLAARLEAARRRAREAKEAKEAPAGEAEGAERAAGRAREKRRRERRRRQGADGGDAVNRVRYTSSRAVLEQYGVPVVISFSHCLPPVLRQHK